MWADRRAVLTAGFSLVLWLALSPGALAEDRFGPVGKPEGALREQGWMIPLPHDPDRAMYATVFRPPGEDKRPLVVINHGSPPKPGDRPGMRPVYKTASQWFVQRGYAVALPVRRGYGKTGGYWSENYGSCSLPNYREAGLESAKDIAAAVEYLKAQPFVAADKIVVVGQSAGGWGALALASRNSPDVLAIVNFAGGRGGYRNNQPNSNCAPDRLIAAAGDYGGTARIPTLWIYAQNDLFFAPSLARGMFDAYAGNGGTGEFLSLGSFGKDGHGLFGASDGLPLWRDAVDRFLKANGAP